MLVVTDTLLPAETFVPLLASPRPLGWVLVVAGFAAGVGTLALAWYLSRHRSAPGATWFVAALGAQALWAFAYTTGLLVETPTLRAFAEALVWIGASALGPLFLAFALAYTGRSDLVRARWFPLVFVVPLVTTVLAVTFPFHGLLWQEFRLAPQFGVTTVLYVVQPWGYVNTVVSLATAASGVLLLVETVVSYGPLYRREATAVALSTLPPASAYVVWILGIGPWPAVNLSAAMFLPHVALDAYAFVGTHMFETNPTTQRAAERGALNDLDDPLFVLDASDRVVNANHRARSVFEAHDVSLPASIDALVGVDLGTLRERDEIEVAETDEVYAVSETSLTDPDGTDVGEILVFYDVTTIRRQEQRLSVLNRVLRHNLRNRLTVTQGYADLIASETTDASIQSHVGAIRTANDQLLSIGRQVRDFQEVQQRGRSVSTVDAVALVEDLVDGVETEYPAARTNLAVDADDPTLETNGRALELVVRNLIHNAVHHSESEEPTVRTRVTASDGAVTFEIRDENEQIPAMEIDTLDSRQESATHHGQGIGLWVVTWCLEYIDGSLSFAYDDGNVVTVTVPRRDRSEGSPSDD